MRVSASQRAGDRYPRRQRARHDQALLQDKPLHEVLDLKGRLRADREDLFEALSTEQLSTVHRFVALARSCSTPDIEQRIAF